MSKKIIIDSLYKEEVRLVLCENDSVEEFDYQNNIKKSIKGNIYLAKIVRIEPSLQAAFVNYGQEKHGFLPFSEIHLEDYILPEKDKKILDNLLENHKKEVLELSMSQIPTSILNEEEVPANQTKEDKRNICTDNASLSPDETINYLMEKHHNELQQFYKKYKIQDVLKRDQELLIQIAKEERGNKGASCTTNISLAGRYSVLMPNARNFEGISKRITDNREKQRIKEILKKLKEEENITEGILIRTACINKTATEIKRDFTYLMRVWENIKNNINSSKAPTFLYEECDIIKRCIRDTYDSEVNEIIVSGKDAYHTAKDFLKLLLPKHAHKVIEHNSPIPIFSQYNIEEQISKLYDNIVYLQSGGYIVINHTEALVAIDINSGKSTNTADIEDTALKINLEAIKELARQIKLRDLSGLIVIDFIDMEEKKNRELVQKEMQRAISKDRARIQIGQISEFGIMEMSRQRMRHNLIDNVFSKCSACQGKGYHRATQPTALVILRAIRNEIQLIQDRDSRDCYLEISASKDVILNLLNNHKEKISTISADLNVKIIFTIDEIVGIDGFFLEVKNLEETKAKSLPMSKIDDMPYEITQQNTQKSGARCKYIEQSTHNKKSEETTSNTPSIDETKRKTHKRDRENADRYSKKSYFKRNTKPYYDKKPTTTSTHSAHKEIQNGKTQNHSEESLLTKIWKKITH